MCNTMKRWDTYFLNVARLTASLSYCKKLQVGAVAVMNRRIICTGYNGTLPGSDNCCEDIIIVDGVETLKTRDTVEHAERNLISFAASSGIALERATLYITHSPCMQCAKAIANAGFVRVVYAEPFKADNGIELLKSLRIETCQLEIS